MRTCNCHTKVNGGGVTETRESFLQTLRKKASCYRVAMDRRGFLKLFGVGVAGLALNQAIPLGRLWSFPKTIVPAGSIELGPGLSIRFIRAFDPLWGTHGALLHRVDVLDRKLFRTIEIPAQFADLRNYIVNNPSSRPIVVALPDVEQPAIDQLKSYGAENPHLDVFGVTYRVEPAVNPLDARPRSQSPAVRD